MVNLSLESVIEDLNYDGEYGKLVMKVCDIPVASVFISHNVNKYPKEAFIQGIVSFPFYHIARQIDRSLPAVSSTLLKAAEDWARQRHLTGLSVSPIGVMTKIISSRPDFQTKGKAFPYKPTDFRGDFVKLLID